MNSVKKCIASVLVLIFVMSALTGCGKPYGTRIYTKEDIVEICGFDKVYERNTTFGDVECVWLSHNDTGSPYNYYDYMTFYIFDTLEDAEAAYKDTEDWFKDKDFKSGRDYRCGWVWGSYDADIYECIYISGNLIISAYLKYSSNYYEEGDETIVTSATRHIDNDDYIESVRNDFPSR